MPSLRTIAEIRKRYNALLTDLQRDGHDIRPAGKSRAIVWRPLRPLPKILFTAQPHPHLPTFYRNATRKVDKVADLMAQIRRGNVGAFKSFAMADAHDNLIAILKGMTMPPHLIETVVSLKATGRARPSEELMADLAQVEDMVNLIGSRLRRKYDFPFPPFPETSIGRVQPRRTKH